MELKMYGKVILTRAELIEAKMGELISLLKQNNVELAWLPVNMLSLDPSMVVHKLNIFGH